MNNYKKHSGAGFQKSALVILGVSSVFALRMATAADPTCVDYFTIGESKCRPAASTPLAGPTSNAPMLVQPPKQTSEVDRYLENYGKPPREFVEFYLNPTPDNAAKWVETYQGMLKKGQYISEAWGRADELYKATTQPQGVSEPVFPTPAKAVTNPTAVILQSNRPNLSPGSIGAFASSYVGGVGGASGIRQSQVSLTYYYSQTCPYCARMTPDLATLSNELSGKLVFTCVDVTPLGPTSGPNESSMTGKLPCKWRLPSEGEIARENVAQTPTLVIEKEGASPVRLSGYVPLSQLRTYFQ